MLFRDVVDLVTIGEATSPDGYSYLDASTKKTVYANKKSVRQNEFYQSYALGIELDVMFEIRTIDYAGEKILEYNDKQYQIVRTYDKNGEITELLCSSKG
jgi:SPP1 family predicted phage head-tail adaptor